MLRLRTLMGNHPHAAPLKKGDVRSDLVALDFADEPVPHEAFKPFVRDNAFDCGELAIVTILQALEFGKGWRWLKASFWLHGAVLLLLVLALYLIPPPHRHLLRFLNARVRPPPVLCGSAAFCFSPCEPLLLLHTQQTLVKA